MNFPVYAIKDQYRGFLSPEIRDNDSVACRVFEHYCTSDNSPFKTKPECYQLFYIGDYDTDTGSLSSAIPRLVACATDFIRNGD